MHCGTLVPYVYYFYPQLPQLIPYRKNMTAAQAENTVNPPSKKELRDQTGYLPHSSNSFARMRNAPLRVPSPAPPQKGTILCHFLTFNGSQILLLQLLKTHTFPAIGSRAATKLDFLKLDISRRLNDTLMGFPVSGQSANS
jgi:hypothetical protein